MVAWQNSVREPQKDKENTTSAATTCTSLRKKDPSARTGTHTLNLKESNSSFQVFCNMVIENGVGVTVIGHDSESETLVKDYEKAGSYERLIQYDLTMEQLAAVIKESKFCRQFISYKCHGSRIYHKSGNQIAWWVSREGLKMNYWGGADIDSGRCACGTSRNCADNEERCNCDNNDLIWREDKGYLTDKNTLPVTALRFGDTGSIYPNSTSYNSTEQGKYTLGKLRCWG